MPEQEQPILRRQRAALVEVRMIEIPSRRAVAARHGVVRRLALAPDAVLCESTCPFCFLTRAAALRWRSLLAVYRRTPWSFAGRQQQRGSRRPSHRLSLRTPVLREDQTEHATRGPGLPSWSLSGRKKDCGRHPHNRAWPAIGWPATVPRLAWLLCCSLPRRMGGRLYRSASGSWTPRGAGLEASSSGGRSDAATQSMP